MNWDIALFYAINGLAERWTWLDAVMVALAQPRVALVPAALIFAYWFWRRRREALIGGAAVAGLILLSDFLGARVKHLVMRTRPCWVLDNVQQLVGCGGMYSFPSNHAVNTAAAAAFMQVLYPRTGWVSWPVVGLIGFARVYVGAHFVTDVVGGWVMGAVLGVAVALLLRQAAFFKLSEGRAASGKRQKA
jgi:undecaprenyl-diphosphatase